MSETAVREILDRIDELPADERTLLEQLLAERAEAEWQREADTAREIASERGLDQAAINDAIRRTRHSA